MMALCFSGFSSDAHTVRTRKSTIYMKRGAVKVMKIRGYSKLPKWKTKNPNVVTIPRRGYIQAAAAGKTSVFARARKRNYSVTVKVMDINRYFVALKDPAVANNKSESTTTLKVFYGGSSVKWKSSKSSIVSVKKGVLTAKKPGKATITATARGKKFTCVVYVPTSSISAKMLYAAPPDSTIVSTLPSTAAITVTNNMNPPTFASSNPAVASVDANGIVTGLTGGKVTVTASVDGLVFSHDIEVLDRPCADMYLNYVEKYSNFVKANGKYFKRADTPTLTFQTAKSLVAQKKDVKVNCRAHCTWAFHDIGFYPYQIYAKKGSFIGRFKGPMTQYLTRITTGGPIGKTVIEAVDCGLLKKGDLCAFTGKTHAFTYGGQGYKFYDGGTVVQLAGYGKVGFKLDYSGVKYYKKNTIGEVLRWNN